MDGPWRNPGGSYKGAVPPIYTKGATLNYFYNWKEAPRERFLGAWAGGGSAGPVLRSQGGSLRPGPADNFGARNRIVTQRSIRS